MLINRSEDVLHFIFNSSWSDITTVVYSSRRRGSTPDSLAGSEQPGIHVLISNRWKEDKLEEENWRLKGRGILLCFQNNCQTLHIRPSTRWSSKHSTAGTRRTTLSSAPFPFICADISSVGCKMSDSCEESLNAVSQRPRRCRSDCVVLSDSLQPKDVSI